MKNMWEPPLGISPFLNQQRHPGLTYMRFHSFNVLHDPLFPFLARGTHQRHTSHIFCINTVIPTLTFIFIV